MIARKKKSFISALNSLNIILRGKKKKYFTRKNKDNHLFLSVPIRLNSQKCKPKFKDLNKFFLMFLLADANILFCEIV